MHLFIFENLNILTLGIIICAVLLLVGGILLKKKVFFLILAISSIFIPMSLFLQYYALLDNYYTSKLPLAISESVQNIIEKDYGIGKFYEDAKQSIKAGKCITYHGFFSGLKEGGYYWLMPYCKDPPTTLSSIDVTTNSENIDCDSFPYVRWRKDMIFWLNYKPMNSLIGQPMTIWFYSITATLILLIFLLGYKYIICSSGYSNRMKGCFVAMVSILPITIILGLTNLPGVYLNSYNAVKNSLTSSNIALLQKIFDDTRKVSLVQSPSFLQQQNINEIFVSRTPLLLADYLRVDLDLYNYLFFFPDEKIPVIFEISRQMHLEKIGEGLYIGKYGEYIHKSNTTTLICWACWVATWIGYMLMIFGLYKKNHESRKSREEILGTKL